MLWFFPCCRSVKYVPEAIFFVAPRKVGPMSLKSTCRIIAQVCVCVCVRPSHHSPFDDCYDHACLRYDGRCKQYLLWAVLTCVRFIGTRSVPMPSTTHLPTAGRT